MVQTDPAPKSIEYDPESIVNFTRAIQELYDIAQKKNIEPQCRHANYLYAGDFSRIIWPPEVADTLQLLATSPEAVEFGVSRENKTTEFGLEVFLLDESVLHFSGHRHTDNSRHYYFYKDGARFAIDPGALGITLTTMALDGALNDEVHLQKNYYHEDLHPIDPLNSTLLRLIESGLSETSEYESMLTYEFDYNNPKEKHSVAVNLRVMRDIDATRRYAFTTHTAAIDGDTSASVETRVTYEINEDMLVRNFLVESMRYTTHLPSGTVDLVGLDKVTGLDFSQLTLDRLIDQLRKNHTSAG